MRRAAIVAVLAAWALAPVSATVLVPASLQDLAQEADVIARGEVIATDVVGGGDWRTIETVVTLAAEHALKGGVGTTVRFRMPGGQLGRYRRVVVGAPEFRVGQRIVVFLLDRGTGLPNVVGLSQGVFRLVADRGEWRVLPTPLMANRPGLRGSPSRQPLLLAEFERQVRAFAGASR